MEENITNMTGRAAYFVHKSDTLISLFENTAARFVI